MNLNDPTTVTLLLAFGVMLLFGAGSVVMVLLDRRARVRHARHS